jgi:gentisate 1,2-dioxygenase
MLIGSGNQFPYADFKKRYDTPPQEPVAWRWADIVRRLGAAVPSERGTLALSLPDGGAEIIRDVAVTYQVVPAGGRTAPHAHTWYHLFVVRSGAGTVSFHESGGTTRVDAGDILLVPAWSPHHFDNPGDEDLVLLNLMNIPLLARLGNLTVGQRPAAAP